MKQIKQRKISDKSFTNLLKWFGNRCEERVDAYMTFLQLNKNLLNNFKSNPYKKKSAFIINEYKLGYEFIDNLLVFRCMKKDANNKYRNIRRLKIRLKCSDL